MTLPEPYGDDEPTAVMDAESILEYIGDDIREWHGLDIIERLRSMNVCIPGLLSHDAIPELSIAWNLIGIEGVGESFSALPYPGGILDQPQAMVQALSIIRSTRNGIQERRIDEARRAPQTKYAPGVN